MGVNGKHYVEKNYTREIVKKKLFNLVELVGNKNV